MKPLAAGAGGSTIGNTPGAPTVKVILAAAPEPMGWLTLKALIVKVRGTSSPF